MKENISHTLTDTYTITQTHARTQIWPEDKTSLLYILNKLPIVSLHGDLLSVVCLKEEVEEKKLIIYSLTIPTWGWFQHMCVLKHTNTCTHALWELCVCVWFAFLCGPVINWQPVGGGGSPAFACRRLGMDSSKALHRHRQPSTPPQGAQEVLVQWLGGACGFAGNTLAYLVPAHRIKCLVSPVELIRILNIVAVQCPEKKRLSNTKCRAVCFLVSAFVRHSR